jgi:reticulon-4-interacting protein 1, mitochondrial
VTLRRLAQAENNPMETKTALFCLGPAAKGALEIRQAPRPEPAADEVEIAIEAASVNPIDVRRAEGYGRRLLSLLGAGRFPMVLGNDFAGTIAATGTRVSSFKPGDRVSPPPPDGDTLQHRPERVTDDDHRADLAFAIPEASNTKT